MDEEPDRGPAAYPRPLTEREAQTLGFMLSAEFAGDAILREQAARAVVVERCTCGCATIDLGIPDDAPVAADAPPVPLVQTRARDMHEHPAGLLLFVRGGRLSSLEIVWYDETRMTADFPAPEIWEPPTAPGAAQS
ncbi:MAG: hypothetical protein ACXVR1_17725 [Solirubrobacteraceae bacterium]